MHQFAGHRERGDDHNPVQPAMPDPQRPCKQKHNHGPGLSDEALHWLNLRASAFCSAAAIRKPVNDIAAAIVTAAHMSRI